MGPAVRLVREPLVYFLLTGAALFAIGERFDDAADHRQIEVTDNERQRLIEQWRAQLGRAPSADELEALIEQWIREEIYYREALAAGLDRDDVIIRRRLAQKLAFLTEATAGTPDEGDLRAWYADHAERYADPERLTFSHRYFSTERDGDAQAEAVAALRAAGSDAPADGDPFMLPRRYVARSQGEIAELFGREFAQALMEAPSGVWHGPVRSAYGWHLVNLEERTPGRAISFDEAAPRVLADYAQHQRQQAGEAFYESLRARYRIVRP